MKRIESQKLDVSKYVGTKVFIAKAEIISSKFGEALKVEGSPVDLKDGDTLPVGKSLVPSILLPLAKDVETEELCVIIDGKTDKFLKSKKVDIVKDIPSGLKVGDEVKALLGKDCVCQKSTQGYLELV